MKRKRKTAEASSMHNDLLDQAKALATLDKGKPKQANLRRAVSSTYYAAFHYLVDRSCRAILGTQNTQRGYRNALARAFVHTTMKEACGSFADRTLAGATAKPFQKDSAGRCIIPAEIREIARTFKELQQKRHVADYDLSERFKRSEVLTLIEQVENDIGHFEAAQTSDARQFFLTCLLAWKQLGGR